MGKKSAVVSSTIRNGLSRNSKFAFAAGLVLVLVAAGALWYWEPWHRHAGQVDKPLNDQQLSRQAGLARQAISSGNPDEAIKQIEALRKQQLSNAQQVALLEQEASAYLQKNDTAKALDLYKQSERLQGAKPDMATSQGLLHIYLDSGDKVQALQYARLVLAAAQASNDPNASDDVPQFRRLVRSLEQEQS